MGYCRHPYHSKSLLQITKGRWGVDLVVLSTIKATKWIRAVLHHSAESFVRSKRELYELHFSSEVYPHYHSIFSSTTLRTMPAQHRNVSVPVPGGCTETAATLNCLCYLKLLFVKTLPLACRNLLQSFKAFFTTWQRVIMSELPEFFSCERAAIYL